MKQGEIVEAAGVEEILESPREPYTQTLLGSMLDAEGPVRVYRGASAEEGQDAC
jgi:ABC-type dipeptide/oligopeptide/nickel transport system ATPase component